MRHEKLINQGERGFQKKKFYISGVCTVSSQTKDSQQQDFCILNRYESFHFTLEPPCTRRHMVVREMGLGKALPPDLRIFNTADSCRYSIM